MIMSNKLKYKALNVKQPNKIIYKPDKSQIVDDPKKTVINNKKQNNIIDEPGKYSNNFSLIKFKQCLRVKTMN